MPLLVALSLAAPAHAQEVGAIVQPQLVVDTADDRPGEDHTEVHTRIRAFARGETGHDGTWFLEVRGSHHVLVGDDTEGWWEGRIGESGWEGELDNGVRLRVGNLVERWGKLDLLPVADVLNPRDLTQGPLVPQELQRIPIPMLTVSAGTDVVRSETTWIPFPTHDRLWTRGTDWSYMRNGMSDDMLGRIATWDGETAFLLSPLLENVGSAPTDLDPSQRRALDTAVAEKGMPQALLASGDLAQRIEVLGNGFDLAVMGAYLRNRQPATALDPYLAQLLRERRLPSLEEVQGADDAEGLTPLGQALAGGPLKSDWPRTGFVAVEGSGVVGPISVRGEAAYTSHKVVRQWYGQATTTPMVSLGAGAVYLRGTALQLTAEARYERRLDAPDELLMVAPEDLMLAGGGRFAFARDRFRLQLGGSYSVAFAEWMFLPKLEWRASDAWRAEIGALLLDSPWNAPPGTPRALIYEGGPAGYFSQNDSLTFTVTWVL